MSSTSAQIDAAKKLAARVEAGEQISPARNTGHASASQLTAVTPEQPKVDIPEDAIVEGGNRENFQIVETREAVPVVKDREIAPVVGVGQSHSLKDQFEHPTTRSEEQTQVPDELKTTAEKNTQLSDETTAAKQTKVDGEEDEGQEKEAEEADSHDDSSPEVTTVEVIEEPQV